jgi:hypothetical protein
MGAVETPAPIPADWHGDLFAGAAPCAACHSNLKDAAGVDFSYNALWQGSMHAHASVDPYYLATVRSETEAYPHLRQDVETKCGVCHLPLANISARAQQQPAAILDDGFMQAEHPLNGFYQEGISCTACHQIRAEADGPAHSGQYTIDTEKPFGQRVLYGPFEISPELAGVMQPVGFVAKQSVHVQESEFCAACHTLYTSPVGADGNLTDLRFPEQTPYLEWRHSAFAATTSCQDCHMPAASGAAKISILNSPEREPVRRHTFTGGNAAMLRLVRDVPALRGNTPEAAVADGLARTEAYLAEQTARLTAEGARQGDWLTLDVQVTNLAGHKLPSGFPSRRVWLHVQVLDEAGAVLFESGGWDARGAIAGNDNDEDPARFEPHYTVIDGPDQVQIYEPVMADLDGAVTTGLIRAAAYAKDNRLLPEGFDKAAASPDIAVRGAAEQDADFTAGGDALTYRVALQGAQGPLTARVSLLYQSIGYRWLENVLAEQHPEADALRSMDPFASIAPVLLAETSLAIP